MGSQNVKLKQAGGNEMESGYRWEGAEDARMAVNLTKDLACGDQADCNAASAFSKLEIEAGGLQRNGIWVPVGKIRGCSGGSKPSEILDFRRSGGFPWIPWILKT